MFSYDIRLFREIILILVNNMQNKMHDLNIPEPSWHGTYVLVYLWVLIYSV